jgi:hypothetical protein
MSLESDNTFFQGQKKSLFHKTVKECLHNLTIHFEKKIPISQNDLSCLGAKNISRI